MPGVGFVDTEGYDSWSAFLGRVRERGVRGVRLVTSDAHEGLRRAVEETFQGAAWQRCAVHLMRDCVRAASGSRRRSRMVQVLPPVASPERLAGAVMCDQDEAWPRSRCFSERVMSELPDEPGAREAAAPTGEQLAAFRLVARRAIEVDLELADELEAA